MMKNTKISKEEGYEEFREVCAYIRLEEEYPGWTGDEKYGIITDLDEEVLLDRFPLVMKTLSPYLMLSKEYGKVRDQYVSNERKYARKKELYESYFDAEGEAECPPEYVSFDFTERLADRELLKEAFGCLTPLQRKRILQLFWLGMSLKEIAESEGDVSPQCVKDTVGRSLAKMKKYLNGKC